MNSTRLRWLLCLLPVLLIAGSAHARFRNTVNRPFATKCNGPQGAIVISHYKGVVNVAGKYGYEIQRQHNPMKLKRAAATYQKMRRFGIKRRGEVRFPRTVVHTLDDRLIRTQLVQAEQTGKTIGDPANNLTFQYQGWSETDRAALKTYLNTAYPKAKLIYGPPAFNMTVKIVKDDTISSIQGGIYDASTNEIRLPSLSGNFPEDTYILLMLVLNAFHDDAMLYYDAWEQGLIGAAAYVIQSSPGISPGYNPVDPGPFYCLSVYEAENQPELGNSTFYPTSGATNMLVWRIAMARAAWLKCWIENSNFFRGFNEAYYAAYTPALPGDVPTLKEIAAEVVPEVEGMLFAEWFERQYVLDTSTRVGTKLYTWNVPLTDAVALIAELYDTTADGDELPVGAQGRTIYWDYQHNNQLYSEVGNVLSIPAGGATPGEGQLLPFFVAIGDAQRIDVQVDIAGLRKFYVYPYGVRGFELGENNLYGAVLGAEQGTVDVTGGNGLTGVSVKRGVWGDRITTGALKPMQIEVSFSTTGGQTTSRIFNIGWDTYLCFLKSAGTAQVSHTFTYGTNGLHLMSLPLEPVSVNLPTLLGIAANRLLLAWWDPWRAGDDKYRLWPSFPVQSPGQGYWLRVPQDTTVNLSGLVANAELDYGVPLGGGWNLVGSPRLTTQLLGMLRVQRGDYDPISWDEAVAQHLVQDSLFSYDQAAGYQPEVSFQPWKGYWMRCLIPTGVTLIFPGTAGQ